MNFAAAIEWSNSRHANRTAITTPTVSRTFTEIDTRANGLARALRELGVEKGDRVGICIGNRIEFTETEWAVAKAGAARVPILIGTSVPDLKYYVEFTEPRVIVADAEELPGIRAALAEIEGSAADVRLIAVGAPEPENQNGAGETREGLLDYEELIEGSDQSRLNLELTLDDLYAIRFTGGTSGFPKGVAMSHRTAMGLVNNMLLNFDIRTDDVIAHFHPMSHAAGMLMATWWMRGARQVILPAFGFSAEKLLETIERERVTSIFTIPTALNVILDCPALNDYDTSSLRGLYYGGAPISPRRITEAIDRFGPILTQVYGHSESPMLLSTLNPEDHVFDGEPPRHLGSAGRPIYNMEVRIIDEDGNDCPPGKSGEIISRGENRFIGYWRDEKLTRDKMLDGGWIRSGDVGQWDEDGFLYLVDRHDDMIISGGFNIWPAEVEKVVCAHPAVAEGVVVGLKDDHWGEAVTAVVVLRSGKSIDPEELIAFCKENMPAYKVPKRVIVEQEELPKSAVGKLLRRAVRDRYQ